ncbi:TPA: ABC transporter ATP-binding protein [Bacillus pseudomycoides]|nr:ABC transporter ATP-binding protein [Bacillus pseudomycoides]
MKRNLLLRVKENLLHIKELLHIAKLLGTMVWRSGPILMIFIFLFIIIEAVVPLLQLYASKKIMDGILNQSSITHTELWAMIYASSLVMVGIIKPIETWVKTLLSEKSMITVNSFLLDAFERIPGMRFFEEPKYRDRLETLRDRSTWLPSQFINISTSLLTAIISLIGVVSMIAYLSPILALILLMSTAPFAFVHNHYNEMEWEYHKEYAPIRRRISYTRDLLLNRQPAKEIRLFGLGEYFLSIYKSNFKTLYTMLKKIQVKSSQWSIIFGLVSGAAMGGGYFWILSQSNSTSLSVGDISLYIGAVLQLSISLRDIAKEGADTVDILRMGKDFSIFMNSEKDITPSSRPKDIREQNALDIELKNVSFRYPYKEEASPDNQGGNSKYVLKNINLSIRAGERVAIVGANGSGKTTLIKLLCRFYDFNRGQININGTSIKDLNVEQIREKIAVVFQEFGRYELSLKENIVIGDIKSSHKEEQLHNAIQATKLDRIIKDLPKGLETLIGPEWGGVDFSGGQWQRIALARAFMKDAGLIVLDEPTASLDIRAEYEIFQQFHNFTQGKTVIMISHRFSTVRMADRIIVLKDGSIVEEGNHDELVNINGEYAKMFRLQAKSFQGKDESLC